MMKYIKNTAPYTQRAAVGFVYLDASMICFPTFNTSTTPIRATSDVVLIIRVRRLTADGRSLRMVCGRMI